MTMTELLTVISVIAILVSMMSPMLVKATARPCGARA